jgi:aryl-alcohol dehydrogenase-like predicted oxidoreductase
VAKAFEAGVNLFDTADVYALGDSERFVGEAVRNLGVPRESYLIATKAFGPMGKGRRMTRAPRVGICSTPQEVGRRSYRPVSDSWL